MMMDVDSKTSGSKDTIVMAFVLPEVPEFGSHERKAVGASVGIVYCDDIIIQRGAHALHRRLRRHPVLLVRLEVVHEGVPLG